MLLETLPLDGQVSFPVTSSPYPLQKQPSSYEPAGGTSVAKKQALPLQAVVKIAGGNTGLAGVAVGRAAPSHAARSLGHGPQGRGRDPQGGKPQVSV